MNKLEKIRKIDPAGLSGENYFQSLLEQATLCGLLSEQNHKRIRVEILALLARETERYNHGKSSSIPVEIAQNILASILFTIGVELKTYADPDDAADAIRIKEMETLFENGIKQIYAKIAATKAIHRHLVDSLLKTPNIFYRPTAVDAIYGFFKLYHPDFGAQEIHITADYPTCNGVTDLAGIEFIRKYVGNLYYENAFCILFSEGKIHSLLCGLSRNYQNLPVNLYEPVLTAALGCVLRGKAPQALELTASDLFYLQQQLADKSTAEIIALLQPALTKMTAMLKLPEDLTAYLKTSLSKIAPAIKNAVASKTIDRVFLIPAYPEQEPRVTFSYGEKMDNDRYRQIIEEIQSCRRPADKMDVIKESVHSLADLEDVLLDAALDEEETAAVLQRLSPIELAALLKHFSGAVPDNEGTDEQKLRRHLKTYIAKLPKEQQQWLFKAVKQLKTENDL